MRKKLFLLVMAASITACDAFSIEEASFAAYNQSADRVMAVVNGANVRELAPNSSAHFTVGVQVARRRVYDYSMGPSQVDKQVQVSVTCRNLRTDSLSYPAMCEAGAKVTTNIICDAQGRVSCWASYTSY